MSVLLLVAAAVNDERKIDRLQDIEDGLHRILDRSVLSFGIERAQLQAYYVRTQLLPSQGPRHRIVDSIAEQRDAHFRGAIDRVEDLPGQALSLTKAFVGQEWHPVLAAQHEPGRAAATLRGRTAHGYRSDLA